MLKKTLNVIISMALVISILCVTCINAFAAGSKKIYVKELVISYGKTADEAKKWLTDNGYTVLDYDLNEGADDLFSTKRAVYLGYKTTDNADEAITDMKLMNMKGSYSVQDYQMLLEEQKENIRFFINNFIIAVNEYRNNYANGQKRAVAAHTMLNLFYDDDTKQYMGDLLLNKIKEEYSDEEWEALSDEDKAKTADMTTILMQANSDAVLTIEQTIAMATDSGDILWAERYESAKTYDEMFDAIMESDNLTANAAEKRLAAEYDDDAKLIASKFEDYKTYLQSYIGEDISFANTADEVEAYKKEHEDFDYNNWVAAGTQYELLGTMTNDDISLRDLILSDEYNVSGADRYLLYPLVSVLTKGQRACLDFLPMCQLVALGINNDKAVEQAITAAVTGIDTEKIKTSVYDGIDRTIFDGDVALTGEAYKLQNATGQSAVKEWSDYISATSIALYVASGVSVVAMAASWGASDYMSRVVGKLNKEATDQFTTHIQHANDADDLILKYDVWDSKVIEKNNLAKEAMEKSNAAYRASGNAAKWAKYFKIAGAIVTCITVALLIYSAWSTYNDLKEYYNAEFTPIPKHMVDQSVGENDEKVYTYYTAVKCNRAEQNMVTDATKLLSDLGDLNGDVGRQWLALYTTKDRAAGNPITTDLDVRYENSDIPKDKGYALSMFGESVAQNLTSKKLGYTYADGKSGIYLFYNVDNTAFAAGSIFSNAKYILIGTAGAAALAAAFFIGRAVGKKSKENA